jgi:hypothetical protein
MASPWFSTNLLSPFQQVALLEQVNHQSYVTISVTSSSQTTQSSSCLSQFLQSYSAYCRTHYLSLQSMMQNFNSMVDQSTERIHLRNMAIAIVGMGIGSITIDKDIIAIIDKDFFTITLDCLHTN